MSLALTTLLLTAPLAPPFVAVEPTAIELATTDTATITVSVRGMTSDEGRMLAMLYDGPKGFPKDQDACMDWRTADIHDGHSSTSFSNLVPGTYAVLVVHDADRDGYLDTNLLGMPKEGVGVSNNGGGIPKFSRASFEVGAGESVSKSIQIKYL